MAIPQHPGRHLDKLDLARRQPVAIDRDDLAQAAVKAVNPVAPAQVLGPAPALRGLDERSRNQTGPRQGAGDGHRGGAGDEAGHVLHEHLRNPS